MPQYQLAQLNIAQTSLPLDSPKLAEFFDNLDRINALADNSPGFIWRLQTAEGNATSLSPLGEDTFVNLSVWKDISTLQNFVYHSAHTSFLSRRREWFNSLKEAHYVLWWIEQGHIPSLDEAIKKLQLLRLNGPTQSAFTFGRTFPTPNRTLHQ